MTRKLLVQCALFLVVILTGVGVHAQDAVDQTFVMTFVPNVQFAPVYVALEKGYFTEQGINLTIEHQMDEPLGLELIASGQRQFGLISGEEVIKARANARPVVSVYEWFQQYPVGIVAVAGTGIESVADLQGRKVGIPGLFGASYNGLVALLSAAGLTESDIQLETIGFNAPEVFCLGVVEAAVVYINNEPLQIQNRIDAGECTYDSIQVFPVSASTDIVSNGLVTNEETIAANPDLVRAMVTAFNAGLRDTINNPAEAYLLSAKYVDNLVPSDLFGDVLEIAAGDQTQFLAEVPSRDDITASRATMLETLSGQFEAADLLQFQVLLNTIYLWDTDQLGYSDIVSWETAQETLLTMGFLEETTDLTAAFTNDFLPAVEE